jgi:uncharacterized protein
MKHCDKKAVTVNVTNKCNLRCEYCMASSAEEQECHITISEDFARKGIYDAIVGIPTGIKATILRFFSPGEPTQSMEILRNCVTYAKQLNPAIKIELQTNGLFESLEDTKWIAENIDFVWFSLDGPAFVNDKHRPDAFGKGRTKEIENNLHYIIKHTFVGVRCTVVEEMLHRQDELVEYYANMGVTYVCLNPVIRQIKRNEKELKEVTKSDIMIFAQGFMAAYRQGQKSEINVSSSLTFNFDEPTCIACRSLLPMPQLNPDGSVSSCDMALYRDTKESLKVFIYGEWNKQAQEIEYDQDKIINLQKRQNRYLPECKDCDVRENCAGGCAGRIAFETGDMFGVIPAYCEAVKLLAKELPRNSRKDIPTHP